MQVVLHQIVHRVIRMHVLDTRKLVQTMHTMKSWSCSMQCSLIIYISRVPSLNNVVCTVQYHTISILQALITMAEGSPKQKTGYVGFQFLFFSQTCLTL